MNEIPFLLRQWSNRARLERSLRGVCLGLAAGLGVALALALIARLTPLLHQSTLIALAVALALLGAGAAWLLPWLRTARRPMLGWARLFDHQFQLRERLSTWLEMRDGALSIADDELRQRLREDAERAAHDADARIAALLPLRLNRRDALIALGLLIALAVALALPNPQERVLVAREQFRQTLNEQARQIAEAEQFLEQSRLSEAQKQALREALDRARQTLQDPNVTPEEALAALNALEAEIEEFHAALEAQQASQQLEALRRAGERIANNELLAPLADALQQGDFERAAEMLRNLIREDGEALRELSAEEVQQIADQLEQMAQSVERANPELAEQLRQSADSLRRGDARAAQQHLQDAAAQLERADRARAEMDDLSNLQSRVEGAQSQLGQNPQAASSGAPPSPFGNTERNEASEASIGQPGNTGDSAQQSDASRGGKSDDTGSDRSIFAPERINVPGVDLALPDANSPTAANPQGESALAPPGRSSVSYETVYRDYARIADDAINNAAVPAGAREYVRNYFSGLDPQQQQP